MSEGRENSKNNVIVVSSDMHKVIKLIATVRNMTISEVAEEYLQRSGIQAECCEILEKNGWSIFKNLKI